MHITLDQLYQAYHHARKGKSKQKSLQTRDMNLTENMQTLYDQIITRTYRISRPQRFLITDTVTREIISLHFSDRIVQHLVHSIIYPILDPTWIADSCASRIGKGTLYGVLRADHHIRSSSGNYQHDTRVMKCDIKSFFYNIHLDTLRSLIIDRLTPHIFRHWHRDRDGLFALLRQIIYADYRDYVDRGGSGYLPSYKLFACIPHGYGLPLGNLTSQLFANIYLNELDRYIKHTLKIKHYVRYVDDFLLIHRSPSYLLDCKLKIQSFLIDRLHLTLHPDKFYLQNIRKGVCFLGIHIYPYHRLVGSRTRHRLLTILYKGAPHIYHSLYSYRGLLIHHDSYRVIQQIDMYRESCRKSS